MQFSGDSHPTSPSYIKEEPNDSPMIRGGFGNSFGEAYSMANGQFDMEHIYGEGQTRESVNPADLTMQVDHQTFPRAVPQSNGFAHGMNFGMQVNDNDLLDTLGKPEDTMMMQREPSMVSEYGIIDGHGHLQFGSAPDSRGQNSPMFNPQPFSYHNQRFAPFQRGSYSNQVETPSSMASPLVGASDDSAPGSGFEFINNNGKKRSRPGMERTSSRKSPIAQSPHTPRTPGIGGLTINTHGGSMPRAIRGHQKSMSNTWESNSPFLESALSSPGIGGPHHNFPDLTSAKHGSLPTKVENSIQSVQDAKRRRRRESHNMVERRRRDNINERIQELSHLVPQHRLEDEKIRKHLANNSALPASLGGVSMSPPRNSMLSSSVGRRTGGLPTPTGLPGDEKDKGPNKGDILNGAVGWTRDLMWAHYKKLKEEEKIKAYITSIGGSWPIEETEEEKRMASELIAAVEKNGTDTFIYTRAPGSGLNVPGFTMINGDPLDGNEASASPATTSSSPIPNGRGNTSSAPPLSRTGSNNNAYDEMIFKEEDEFNMDM